MSFMAAAVNEPSSAPSLSLRPVHELASARFSKKKPLSFGDGSTKAASAVRFHLTELQYNLFVPCAAS